MPRKDGTGPEGKGPRTGRGLGDCSNDEEILKQKRKLGKILTIIDAVIIDAKQNKSIKDLIIQIFWEV